jgi:hypothetical protein
MELEFSLRRNDIFEACSIIQQRNSAKKRGWFGPIIFILGLIFCALFNLYQTEGTAKGLLLILVGAGVGTILTLITYAYYSKRTQESFLSGDEGVTLSKRVMKLSENGIEQRNRLFESVYKWESVKECVETTYSFLVLFDNSLFQSIPKKELNDQTIQDLRELLNNHCSVINWSMNPQKNKETKDNVASGW